MVGSIEELSTEQDDEKLYLANSKELLKIIKKFRLEILYEQILDPEGNSNFYSVGSFEDEKITSLGNSY